MPLQRIERHRSSRLLLILLVLAILGQWVLVIGSCALQNWDTFLISIWIGTCATVSSYVYPPGLATSDWLQYHCRISVTHTKTEFSSRRALLSALVVINLDTPQGCTWIDPILAKTSQERKIWESSLVRFIKSNKVPEDRNITDRYWWKYVTEGVDIGRKIMATLKPANKFA
jgi:hypothetical protein